jgi:hypothetical protein
VTNDTEGLAAQYAAVFNEPGNQSRQQLTPARATGSSPTSAANHRPAVKLQLEDHDRVVEPYRATGFELPSDFRLAAGSNQVTA